LRAAARAHGRRVRALLALIHGRPSAGHGVDRSNSPKNLVGAGFKPARAMSTRTPASTPVAPSPTPNTIRVHLRSSAVQTPFSAGHGVDRSFSNSTAAGCPTERAGLKPAPTPTGRRAHLHSSAASTPVSAGHGLHPSFFDARPALR
jgi:hypothetical protein